MEFKPVRVIGGKGTQTGSFSATLRGITIDGQDRLLAAGDSKIQVFDATGNPIAHWKTASPALSVAVADDGSVWAGEAGQLEIFGRDGKLLDTWRDPERLGHVTAIDFAGDSVLVGDAADRCIRRFDRGGKFLNNIAKDNRRKGLLIPNGSVDFSVDSAGVIHAANPGKHRVERYTPDGELLGHIGHFDGVNPTGFSGCCNPTNVVVTGKERIYVTEKADPRAKVLDFEGKLLAVVATDVFHPACKNMDIAVDSRSRVYVADTVTLAIHVFEPMPGGAQS